MNGQSVAKEKRFADFEVWIGPAALPAPKSVATYPTIVTSSPSGPAFAALKLNISDKKFQTELALVQSAAPDLNIR